MSNLYNLLKTIIEKLNATKDTVNNLPQPDWNQNDETAHDYVKNRPFYEGKGRVQLFQDQVNVTTQSDDTYYVADLNSNLPNLISGTITVQFYGEVNQEYTNVPITEYYVGAGMYEFDYLGGKDGYPFKITSNKIYVATPGYYYIFIYTEDAKIVKQIDPKFIPTDPLGIANGSSSCFATNNKIKDFVKNKIDESLQEMPDINIKSSTFGSTKKFKITINDDSSVKITNTLDSSTTQLAAASSVPTDHHINELINTALGVIENGSY